MNKRSKSTTTLRQPQPPIAHQKNLQSYNSAPPNHDQNIYTLFRHQIMLAQGGQINETEISKSKKDRAALMAKVSVPIDEKNHLFLKSESYEGNCKSSTRQTKLGSLNFKIKSVYEQYRDRIEKRPSNFDSHESRNPQLQILRQKNEELKNSMLTDIKRLRLAREKSQKSLKKSQSTNDIQHYKEIKVKSDRDEAKGRALQKNREKLAKLR